MLKVVIPSEHYIRPFNERARDLRIQNKPLWLIQRDALARYTTHEVELGSEVTMPSTRGPTIVYRDNLYFDAAYIAAFIEEAGRRGRPCRAAYTIDNSTFREHALPLSATYEHVGDHYLADLWYFPEGPVPEAEPLIVETTSVEIGYYRIPSYMATDRGELVFQVPLRGLLAIDSWVHVFIADVVFGVFSRGAQFEHRIAREPFLKLGVLLTGMFEGKQVLESSRLVKIGRGCQIDPTAVIHGPTTIGDNVTIGAGVVIENAIIGNDVNISQGSQVMLSVIGDGSFLPFRAALFMTTLMENSMVAQNTCLQMCVVGRNTFIGAGTTFTDFNLIPKPLRAIDGSERLSPTGRSVLGGCVGHNCRLGSGLVIMPARTIESDVVLLGSNERRIIQNDITFKDSDHHHLALGKLHSRRYPPPGKDRSESW
jgi:carbonic anhydrase/acetyltransferase-like protein (isoleucine patch superfamily)